MGVILEGSVLLFGDGTGWRFENDLEFCTICILYSLERTPFYISLHIPLDEYILRTTAQSEDEVQSRLLLDVVVGQCATVFELFSRENESLLIRRDALLVLNLLLDRLNCVGCLRIERDGLSRECLDKNLHHRVPVACAVVVPIACIG